MFSRASVTRAILLSVLACPTACVLASRRSRRRCGHLQDAARLIRRGGAAAAGETGAVMPPIDEEYDLLLTEDFGGGGGGGAGFPSHNGDDETLLYPTLASTTSMPKTDTKKAFFLLGLIGAVADLDRRAFFVVVAVTNLYAMRFLKAHVRPALTKWMCCNTRFPVWKSTSRRWRNLISTQATPRQRHRPHDTIGADDHAARGRHGLGPAEEQEQADDHGVRAGRPLREVARPVRPLILSCPNPVQSAGSVMYTCT